jgi:hypothetical protein
LQSGPAATFGLVDAAAGSLACDSWPNVRPEQGPLPPSCYHSFPQCGNQHRRPFPFCECIDVEFDSIRLTPSVIVGEKRASVSVEGTTEGEVSGSTGRGRGRESAWLEVLLWSAECSGKAERGQGRAGQDRPRCWASWALEMWEGGSSRLSGRRSGDSPLSRRPQCLRAANLTAGARQCNHTRTTTTTTSTTATECSPCYRSHRLDVRKKARSGLRRTCKSRPVKDLACRGSVVDGWSSLDFGLESPDQFT